VRSAALKVKRGEAAYERDAVLFDRVEHAWPLLASLMWVAARERGRLEVLDFGGSLGSSYVQNRAFVDTLPESGWSIVEQPHFVSCGKADFEGGKLRFFETIEACATARAPNVVVLSSVLQYLEDPGAVLAQLGRFPYLVIDLTPVHDGPRDRLTLQTVPPTIYPARYPCWVFSEARLAEALGREFELVTAFDPELGQDLRADDVRFRYRGYLLKRRAA
jgi:putative methyltransferase (TIGR04325 family)